LAKQFTPADEGLRPRQFPRKKRAARSIGLGRFFFSRATPKIFFCLLVVCGQAVLFSLQQQISHLLLLLVILPGLVFGILWHLLEEPEYMLGRWLSRRLGRVFAGFCLFFLHLVFYIALFSLVVSYPVGLLIGAFWGSMDLVRAYTLYSINSVFALACFSWFQWWRATSCKS
jgi:hypothetical protein